VAPAALAADALQKTAELPLRMTGQHEHRCSRFLPLHSDSGLATQQDEAPSSTTRNLFMYAAGRKVANALLTFLDLLGETVASRGCRGMGCSAGGPCREGMKTSHKRRADKGRGREEGRQGETVSGRGPASRGKTLRLRRGCRGVGCSAGGPCREGMKTSHQRRADKGC
jgi:hypothetical protein